MEQSARLVPGLAPMRLDTCSRRSCCEITNSRCSSRRIVTGSRGRFAPLARLAATLLEREAKRSKVWNSSEGGVSWVC